MELSLEQREKILSRVRRLVEKKYYDATFNGHDWSALVESQQDQILRAPNAEEFERKMHHLVSQLRVSHIGFFHKSVTRVPSRRSICADFHKVETEDGLRWVLQGAHEDGPASKTGLRPGDVLLRVNSREIRPPEEPVFPMGETTTATVRRGDGSETLVEVKVPETKSRRFPYCEPRLVSHAKLGDSVGWLKVSMFPGQIGIDVAGEIDEGIAHLSDCERLIVDLRGNSGGGLGMLRLMSYFTPDKLPVGYSLTRRRAQKGYRKEDLTRFGRIPARKTALLGIVLRYGFIDKSVVLVTEGLGSRRFHGRMVILINEHSASASEVIAAFANEYGLAKLVGSPTVGRLLSGNPFRVGMGYVLVVPTAAYLTWQGHVIEGRGVQPDYLSQWSWEAARCGHDNQLEKAIEVVKSL